MKVGHRCSVDEGLAKLVMGHERTYVLQNYVHKYIYKYIYHKYIWRYIYKCIEKYIYGGWYAFAQIYLQQPDVNIDLIAMMGGIKHWEGQWYCA